MKNRTRTLIGCAVVLFMGIYAGCKGKENSNKQPMGMVRDSCSILVMPKPPGDPLKQDTAEDSPMAEDTLIDLVVRLETEKKGFDSKELLFGMERKFELQLAEGRTLMPVFCQPIATGSNSRFSYWVSFEALKKDWLQGPGTLIIHDNPLIKDSVHYIL